MKKQNQTKQEAAPSGQAGESQLKQGSLTYAQWNADPPASCTLGYHTALLKEGEGNGLEGRHVRAAHQAGLGETVLPLKGSSAEKATEISLFPWDDLHAVFACICQYAYMHAWPSML